MSIFSKARRASLRRPLRVRASTYQKEQMEKVPSSPSRPSGLASGSYRQTRESDTSSSLSASRVDSHTGSVGETNLVSGIISTAASSTSPSSYWTNACRAGDHLDTPRKRNSTRVATDPAACRGTRADAARPGRPAMVLPRTPSLGRPTEPPLRALVGPGPCARGVLRAFTSRSESCCGTGLPHGRARVAPPGRARFRRRAGGAPGQRPRGGGPKRPSRRPAHRSR